jgi:pilus assembly protein CpaE
MHVQLNCVIVDADTTNREELALLNRPDAPVLAIVNLDPNPQDMLKKIATLPRQFPAVSFFLMSQTVDPNLLMDAMHLGIREFIPLPISEEKFSSAIERVAQQHGMGKRARIIHVIPTIGGCGSTTVACNMAAAMAPTSRTALIDLDLMRGGVASYFDTRARYTISDIMDSAQKLDKQLLDNALAIHKKSNLAILARPELPEDAAKVNVTGLARVLNVLSRSYDSVIVDSLMSISPMYASVLQQADINLLVMQLNIPSAKNAERFVGAMRRMGIDSSKIRMVVNRHVKKGNDIEPEEIEKALGLKVSWLVPNDFKNAIGAINFGEPVVLRAPRSEMSTSLIGLAAALGVKPSASGVAA